MGKVTKVKEEKKQFGVLVEKRLIAYNTLNIKQIGQLWMPPNSLGGGVVEAFIYYMMSRILKDNGRATIHGYE